MEVLNVEIIYGREMILVWIYGRHMIKWLKALS